MPEDSVVRVQVYSARYDYQAPWRLLPPGGGVGSGLVVAGGRILTNAHVVRDAREVLVKKHHVADPFVAKVEAVGNDCDLALLSVADPKFAEGLKPLELGGLPKERSVVTTYGYPMAGQEVSSTKGIVSRVEWGDYVHTDADAHVMVLTDAAINPGNSGGPVIQDGKVVGVAFQGLALLQNVGYFIPEPVIRHFLDDLKDGRYDGFPSTGAHTFDLVSPAYRKERALPVGKTGVVVDAVAPGASAEGALKSGDVLMAVERQPVADDGTVQLGTARITFHHLFDMKQLGQPIAIQVWRDGKVVDLTATARSPARSDRHRNRYGVAPRYYVFAGLVFMPLDRELLKTYGEDWRSSAPRPLMWHYAFREAEAPESADDETVVLARVLQHPVNSQMAVRTGVVARVNDVPIKSLADFAKTVDAARKNRSGFLVLDFEEGEKEALDVAQAEAVHAAIDKAYGITRDQSL
jgi:S1-C subfamily serine protease